MFILLKRHSVNLLSLTWLCLTILSSHCRNPATAAQGSIEHAALQNVLQNASPIFGNYEPTTLNTSRWMADYPDRTILVHMNLPGTHDSQTWNYSSETRKSLKYISRIGGTFVAPYRFYRCQEESLLSMLDKGIRVFDLRFAFDITKTKLVFWHAQALQSQTATVDDVLFSFYHWLDDHPTETVLISLKYEGATTLFGRNSAKLQHTIYDILTSEMAQKYIAATKNALGTLGEARGKIVLLRRFDLDKLPEDYSEKIPGVHFPTSKWKKNDPNMTIIYNEDKNYVAHIEDFYHITTKYRNNFNLEHVVKKKYKVTIAHIESAVTGVQNHLYWSFASGEKNLNIPSCHPKIVALGTEKFEGMNQRLIRYFQSQAGSNNRLGIVTFDFFHQPEQLIESFLAIKPP